MRINASEVSKFSPGSLWITTLFFAFILSSLTACKSIRLSSTLGELSTQASTDQVLAVTTTEAPSQTPTLELTQVMVQVVESPISTVKTLPPSAPDPFRFEFPEAPPVPISVWRPPLYPIPWAPSPYDHFYFSRPIAADEVNWPLADYRYGGVFFEDVVHTGVDIPAAKGTPVLAAGDGKVVWSGWGLYSGVVDDLTDPYGQSIVIRHDFGFQGYRLFSVYGHLDRIDVTRGQHVELGEPLGLVGETGFVTGPHLHFEVRVGESDFFQTLNPELWLAPPQGWGVLVARIMDTSGQLYAEEIVHIKSRETGLIWKGIPYAQGAVNHDPYYQENLVISDLPAGLYDITISYAAKFYFQTIEIFPGQVTYFAFKGRDGYSLERPVVPGVDFNPFQDESAP